MYIYHLQLSELIQQEGDCLHQTACVDFFLQETGRYSRMSGGIYESDFSRRRDDDKSL